MSRRGFTLVEIVVAVLVLTIVLLGLARFAGSFVRETSVSRIRLVATAVAQERIELVQADTRYGDLVATYSLGPGADTTGFYDYAGMRRRTTVVRDRRGDPPRDFTTVTVTVTAPGLPDAVSLTTVVAAP